MTTSHVVGVGPCFSLQAAPGLVAVMSKVDIDRQYFVGAKTSVQPLVLPEPALDDGAVGRG